MPIAAAITTPASRMRDYAKRVTGDLSDHNFARLPTWGMGGQTIACNHPAWVFGHLAIYPNMLLKVVGSKTTVPIPENFEALFKNGTPCLDDPNGSIYPSMAITMSAYFAGTDAIIAAASMLSDADLGKANPDEHMAKYFPTVAECLIFMLNNHNALHIGQISTWRRAMGLPAA